MRKDLCALVCVTPGMKNRKTKILSVFVTIAAVLLAYICFIPSFKQFCGESAVYRVGFELYTCEHNDESAENFYCGEKIGSSGASLFLRDLTAEECGERQSYRLTPILYRLGVLE